MAFSLVPLIVFQAFKQFSDGLSLTKYPMYATIIANILNVIINYILIFGKFGFPEMGIVGAAYCTLASRFIMVVYLWLLLRYKKRSAQIVKNIKFLHELFNINDAFLNRDLIRFYFRDFNEVINRIQ